MTAKSRKTAAGGNLAGLGLAVLALAALGLPAEAQDPSTAATSPTTLPRPSGEQLTEKALEIRLEAAKKDEGLTPAQREQAVAQYELALAQVRLAEQTEAKAAAYAQDMQAAPEEIRRLQQAASQPASGPAVEVPSGLSLEQMKDRLKQLEVQLADLQKQDGQLALELKDRAARRADLPNLIAQQREQLQKAQAELDALKGADEPPALKEGRRVHILSRSRGLQAQVEAGQGELAASDVHGQLLRARQGFVSSRISQLQGELKVWQAALSRAQQQQARQQVEQAVQAQQEAAGKHQLVQELAAGNTGLARMDEELTRRRAQAERALAETEGRLGKLQKVTKTVEDIVAKVGLTDAIGTFLRGERANLPDVRRLRADSGIRQQEIKEVQVRLFDLNERLAKLEGEGIDQQVRQLVASAEPGLPARPPQAGPQAQELLAAVREALSKRQELLKTLVEHYDQYFDDLFRLVSAESRLISAAESFSGYVKEQILWIRSAGPLSAGDAVRAGRSLVWLADPRSWAGAAGALWSDLTCEPVLFGLAVAGLGALVGLRRKMTRTMLAINRVVDEDFPGTFRKTLAALALALLLSVTWPLTALFLGGRLAAGYGATVFSSAVGNGVMVAAAAWWPLRLLWQLCRKGGMGQTHFRWPAQALRTIVRSRRWVAAVGLPLVFLAACMSSQAEQAYSESLGRIALVSGLVLLSGYLAWVLRPGGPLVAQAIGRQKRNWLYRSRYVWHPLAAGVPLALALAAALGYFYTAQELSWRLLAQFWVILLLILLYATLMRWRLLARRKLALRTAEQRRQAEKEKQAQAEQKQPLESQPELEQPEVNLYAVNVQTRQMIRYLLAALLVVSVWAVWSDVLPALKVLREVRLWQVGADGAAAVTLADLLLAVLIGVLTVVASRNIPGMLELVALQRLKIQSGGRNAITALTRYAITAVGAVLAFEAIGLKWSHVQWLIAAMTVGLGFGLQEIFANFVSGLIILVERPIRVGDVVTVAEVTGTVTRIRIRATTITDWDRKELIVPNKSFITGQLVNWTLSDNVIRVVLPVGVAYGSDTALAHRLLLEIARANQRVLKDPAPQAFFLGFGDSSLNFELRAYVGGLTDYLAAQHELHMQIDEAFRRHCVEIAFPQRDIHIRSIQPPLRLEGLSGEAHLPPEARQGAAEQRAVDPPKDL